MPCKRQFKSSKALEAVIEVFWLIFRRYLFYPIVLFLIRWTLMKFIPCHTIPLSKLLCKLWRILLARQWPWWWCHRWELWSESFAWSNKSTTSACHLFEKLNIIFQFGNLVLLLVDFILELSSSIFLHSMPILFHWLTFMSIFALLISFSMVSLAICNSIFLSEFQSVKLSLILKYFDLFRLNIICRGCRALCKMPSRNNNIRRYDVLVVYFSIGVMDSNPRTSWTAIWAVILQRMMADEIIKIWIESRRRWPNTYWGRVPGKWVKVICSGGCKLANEALPESTFL